MDIGDLVVDYSFVPKDEEFDLEPRQAIVIGHESQSTVRILRTDGQVTTVPQALLRKVSLKNYSDT